MAATINLNLGDSIVLQPNTTTAVTCGGANSICSLPVKNLKLKFDYCSSIVTNSVEECLNQIWPNFSSKNSQCIEEATGLCISFCRSSLRPLDCLEICK